MPFQGRHRSYSPAQGSLEVKMDAKWMDRQNLYVRKQTGSELVKSRHYWPLITNWDCSPQKGVCFLQSQRQKPVLAPLVAIFLKYCDYKVFILFRWPIPKYLIPTNSSDATCIFMKPNGISSQAITEWTSESG